MSATHEKAPRLVPPIPQRTPRPLTFVLSALVPLALFVAPLWVHADGATMDTWGSALGIVLAATVVVWIGAGVAWAVDRVDGVRSNESKRRRSVVLGASVSALLTVILSATVGSALGVSSSGFSSTVTEGLLFGTLLGGSMSIWLAPLVAIPASALGTVLVARSAGVRDTAMLVLLAWIGGVSLIGATADPVLPRLWAIGVVAVSAAVCLGAAVASLHRLFWAIRLVCTPHRFWRLEVTDAHPDQLPDLPRLSSSEHAVVLMLRDDSAGGPFRGADAFHAVAVLPRSAATWVLTTLARATVALSLGCTTVALALTSL